MAEHSGFFDAHLVDGAYDRVYLAENFAKYFASFIGNGIFAGKSNELMVRQKSTANMSVRVLSGQGWINGYWYENTHEVSLDISVADGVLNRIDIIVLRWDNSERVVRLAVKRGTPASIPSAPTLQRTEDFYELKLAQITVNAGTTRITDANILDTRLNSADCGYVHAVVDQLDSSELGVQLDAYISEFVTQHNTWSSQFKANSESLVDTLIRNKTNEINELIELLEQTLDESDAVAINSRIDELSNEISKLKISVSDTALLDTKRFSSSSVDNPGKLAINYGGTGATSLAEARKNLGIASTMIYKNVSIAEWEAGSFMVISDAITETCVVEIAPGYNITLSQLEALQKAQIVGGSQYDGRIEIKCLGDNPAVEIPVMFIVRGDL